MCCPSRGLECSQSCGFTLNAILLSQRLFGVHSSDKPIFHSSNGSWVLWCYSRWDSFAPNIRLTIHLWRMRLQQKLAAFAQQGECARRRVSGGHLTGLCARPDHLHGGDAAPPLLCTQSQVGAAARLRWSAGLTSCHLQCCMSSSAP